MSRINVGEAEDVFDKGPVGLGILGVEDHVCACEHAPDARMPTVNVDGTAPAPVRRTQPSRCTGAVTGLMVRTARWLTLR
ncbi:hypothetical protein GCM10023335_39140 [Streptomyces siamensis]|uniref:Uncharacterized protein n=1 Tax=Streptomyces siamensis TaxID=1274986 RepID=A0ABP9J105_9ACTN